MASLDIFFQKLINKDADRSAPLLFANPEDRVSCVEVHICIHVSMSGSWLM